MRYLVLFFILITSQMHCFSLEKLSPSYQIVFGNQESSVQVVQYFSFTCPHCLSLYRKDFQEIKSKYLETEKVLWIFHPVPMDLLTVQAMDCLEKLSDRNKRLFLEAILDVMPMDEPTIAVCYMQKAMELFEQPIPNLQEKDYLSQTRAFQDAFLFLKQEEKINAVPTLSINGHLFVHEVPDMSFIDKKMQEYLPNAKSIEMESK